jgi:NAD(P)-dependent dehydrogenase (short-subunit alcohol dehydrogenase family)
MRFDLAGKVCVITGAGRGIGRVMSADFAADGAKVVGCSRRAEPLDSLAREIAASGGDFLPLAADLSRIEECERLIAAATERYGQVDVLVNNLGIGGAQKAIRDLQPAEWMEAINTNLSSVYGCIHYAVGGMMDRKSGAIVNISSIGPKIASPYRVPYVTTKMGMIGITRVLAQELGPYNIRVNAVSPGFVDGERSDEVQEAMAKNRGITAAKMRDIMLQATPLRRSVPPGDISQMVRFLASDAGRSISGQDIAVDAGLTFS